MTGEFRAASWARPAPLSRAPRSRFTVTYVETFDPSSDDRCNAKRVDVRAGQDTPGIDIKLALEQRFTIVGTIADVSGLVPRAIWLEWGSIDGDAFGHDDMEASDASVAIREVLGRVGLLARAVTREGASTRQRRCMSHPGPVRGIRLKLAAPVRVRGRAVMASVTPAGRIPHVVEHVDLVRQTLRRPVLQCAAPRPTW